MKIQLYRLRRTEKQLERIANALEELLYQAYGYRMAEPKPYDGPDESGVEYASDMSTLKVELSKAQKGKRVDAPPEDD